MSDSDSQNGYRRKLLIEEGLKNYRAFDIALLSVSSGAVVLSITMIVELEKILFPRLILLSWVFWFISITFQLLAYLVSSLEMGEQIRIEDVTCMSEMKNRYGGWTSFVNALSLLLFFLGSATFLFFAYNNLISSF